MRIHRPNKRKVLTTLKLWLPPLTWATANVRPLWFHMVIKIEQRRRKNPDSEKTIIDNGDR